MSRAMRYSVVESGMEVFRTEVLFDAAFSWTQNRLKRQVWVLDLVPGQLRKGLSRVRRVSDGLLSRVLERDAAKPRLIKPRQV